MTEEDKFLSNFSSVGRFCVEANNPTYFFGPLQTSLLSNLKKHPAFLRKIKIKPLFPWQTWLQKKNLHGGCDNQFSGSWELSSLIPILRWTAATQSMGTNSSWDPLRGTDRETNREHRNKPWVSPKMGHVQARPAYRLSTCPGACAESSASCNIWRQSVPPHPTSFHRAKD